MPPSSGLPGGFHHQNGLNMRLPMDYQQNYYIKKVEPALPQPNYYVRKTVEATRGRVIPRGPKQQPSAVKPKLASCGLPGCKGCQIPNLKFNPSVGDGGPPRVRNPSLASTGIKPLFVDCSVEYELPNVPKIPPDSQPLLVIHPGWKRRVTRSSSQQRLIIEAEQRKHQQYLQYHMFNCAQCPQQPPVQLGRKRTYHQAASLPQPHIRRPQPQPHPLTGKKFSNFSDRASF